MHATTPSSLSSEQSTVEAATSSRQSRLLLEALETDGLSVEPALQHHPPEFSDVLLEEVPHQSLPTRDQPLLR